MAKAPGPSFCAAKVRTVHQCDPDVARHRQVGNTFPVLHLERLLTVVDEHHAHFAPEIGVDGAWRIKHRDTMLERQPAAGTHLGLGAFGQFQEEAGRDQRALAGGQTDGRIEVGAEVHAGAVLGGVGGKGLLGFVNNANGKLFRSDCGHVAKGRSAGRSIFQTPATNANKASARSA